MREIWPKNQKGAKLSKKLRAAQNGLGVKAREPPFVGM